MVRDVTDEQRSRQPIFIATLRAAASWPFFRVARSLRINSDRLVVTASPARTANRPAAKGMLFRGQDTSWKPILPRLTSAFLPRHKCQGNSGSDI